MVKKIWLILILLGVALGGLFWWVWAISPACHGNCSSQVFIVNKGESLKSVAYRLKKDGIIRSSLAFQVISFSTQTSGKIQAGSFTLSPAMEPTKIARQLTHGISDVKIILVEGLRKEEIAGIAGSELPNFDWEEFLKITSELEGQLFPDTYLIPKEADAQKVVDILTKNYKKKVGTVSADTLILASLVEREVHGEDRLIVAGILAKRILNGWPLQVDATVQYAVGSVNCKYKVEGCDWWPKNLTKNDLEIKSPYNTYLNKGLPPGPICNPGLAAIRAAINPVQADYWYYLSDKNSVTRYAKTIEEHNQNIRRYLLE